MNDGITKAGGPPVPKRLVCLVAEPKFHIPSP